MYKINHTSPAFKISAFVLAVILLLLSFRAFATDYKVDPEHSRVGFSIKEMMLTNMHGQFNDFSGTFSFDAAKYTMTNADFKVQTASISTGVSKRDEHLKSADFFDVAKYPTMTLTDVKIKRNSKDSKKFLLTGNLTIKGITKPAQFNLTYTGSKKNVKTGVTRAGFNMVGVINRHDYGITWAPPIEGDIMINNDVTIEIDVSAIEVVK